MKNLIASLCISLAGLPNPQRYSPATLGDYCKSRNKHGTHEI